MQDESQALIDLPVFPLGTVLFPGGSLPLRIFEARYMDMARDCLKNNSPFGVCLIRKGKEVGEAADHEDVGCLAKITEWDMEQLGMLQVLALGEQRFSIVSRRVQADGLIRVDAVALETDPPQPVPEIFNPCVSLLDRIVRDLVEKEPSPIQRMITGPYHFESSSWVSNRLAEFLPISTTAKQKLMELPDPLVRLEIVDQYLRQHRVI